MLSVCQNSCQVCIDVEEHTDCVEDDDGCDCDDVDTDCHYKAFLGQVELLHEAHDAKTNSRHFVVISL